MGFAAKDLEAIEQSLLEGKSINVPESFLPEVYKDLRERISTSRELLRQTVTVLRVIEMGHAQGQAEREKAAAAAVEEASKKAQAKAETDFVSAVASLREYALSAFGRDGSTDSVAVFNRLVEELHAKGHAAEVKQIGNDEIAPYRDETI